MTKTVSIDQSIELTELGFNRHLIVPTDYLWEHNGIAATRFRIGAELEDKTVEQLATTYKLYPAYDLESILEALPMGIDKYSRRFDLVIEQNCFAYYSDSDGDELLIDGHLMQVVRRGDESVANMTARLLIMLTRAGEVTFVR